MTLDHKVPWKDVENIAALALEWRKLEGHYNSPSFNILEFLQFTLPNRIIGKAIEIRPTEIIENDLPALVCFKRERKYGYQLAELLIKPWILKEAKLNGEKARFIIAHEIGHLVLHDCDSQPFSPGMEKKLRFLENEESAEWQANQFADQFLVPRHIGSSFTDASELAQYCHVELECAKRRIQEIRAIALRNKNYSGNSCGQCGDFRLKSFGSSHFCENCGSHSTYI